MGSKDQQDEESTGMPGDEWSKHRLFITESLKDLKEDSKEQNKTLRDIKEMLHAQDKEIERLKMKSSLYGLLGGLASGISLKLADFLPFIPKP